MAEPAPLPNVVTLIGDTLRAVLSNPLPWCLVAVPLLAGFLVDLLASFGISATAITPGLVSDRQDLVVGGALLGIVTSLLITMVTMAPLTAGLYRAVWAYKLDQEPLGLGSALSRMSEDLGSVLLLGVLNLLAAIVGMSCCYVGLFVPAVLFDLALPAIVVHRMGAIEAMRFSASHVTRNPAWHVGYWGIGFVVSLVAGYVPIVGGPIGVTILAAYQLETYRALFGDGPEPRLSD
jgi:uncharacterized membrane protein